MKTNNVKKGFTLIEILVVVALIAILAAVTIVAINPGKNFADTRNTQRSADVSTILNAITQFTSEEGRTIDDLGTIRTCGDAAGRTKIGTTSSATAGEWANLQTNLVDEYLVAVPKDPEGTDADTLYEMCKTTGGRVEVHAPNAENGKVIAAKR
jgi:prepilin-type N-terminal cleavage/methylation domain-containing protein